MGIKPIKLPFYAVLLSLGLTIPTWAISASGLTPPEDSPVVTDPKRMPVPQSESMQGTIKSIDRVKQTVDVQNPAGQVKTFHLDTNTPISDSQSAQKTFEDLKVRDPITVQYDPEGSQTHKVQIPAKR